MTFSEKLQELRKTNRLSQEQLAEKCKVSRQAVSKWELGQGYPEMENLLLLCDLFEVDLDYLVRDKEVEHRNTMQTETNNIYKAFQGKWVKVFINDKEFQGLYQVACIAINNHYMLFEQNSKKGIIKTPDIKSMTDSNISKRKLEKMPPIITQEISDDYNPYEQFIGKTCHIRLKCNSFFAYPQGFYAATIEAITAGGMIISQKGKSTAIKTSDILMVIEN